MTREEALKIIKNGCRIVAEQIRANDEETTKYNLENIEALNMAVEALEQEPKTGHWKKIATYPLYECSKCKLESMLNTWDYCPNCGCRMVEPQESEDKE